MQPRGSIRKDCYARVQQAPTCVPLRLEVAASGSLACSRPCFQGTSSGLRRAQGCAWDLGPGWNEPGPGSGAKWDLLMSEPHTTSVLWN